MADTKKLEEHFEKLTEILKKGMAALEGFDEDNDEADGVQASIQRLADTLHQRVASIPKDAQYVRLSKLNAFLLVEVMCGWAKALEGVGEEFRSLAEEAGKAISALDEANEEFDSEKEKLLELLEEHAPELDITSDLREAER